MVMTERKKKVEQPGCPQGTPHHHWQIETARDADNRSLGKCRNCKAERLFWNGYDHEGPRDSYGQYVTGEARIAPFRSRHFGPDESGYAASTD